MHLICYTNPVLEIGDVQLGQRGVDHVCQALRDTLSVGLQILEEIFALAAIRKVVTVYVRVLQYVPTL